VVNGKVPTEQNLAGSHHTVITQVGQETPLQPTIHSPFLRFPKQDTFTGKTHGLEFVERFDFEACLRVSAFQFTRGSALYRELFQFLD
jgi:hypothetical protein